MSESQSNPSSEERQTAFTNWLKPIKPLKPARPTILNRIAPWRHEFAAAVAAGYTWAQLAKEIAPKPEIGVTISGNHLKKCVHDAFVAAKETTPASTQSHRRRKRAKRASQAAATPTGT